MEAKALQSDPAFIDIVAEIQSGAMAFFLDPNSDITALAKAHEAIRAVETFRAALQARIDAESVEDKAKGRHRVND